MSLTKVIKNKIEFEHEFLFFRVAFVIANTVTWSYYMILLLRESENDISITFMNQGVLFAGIALGFLLASMFLSKTGYLRMFQLANVALLTVTILTIITLPQILEVHLIMAILRGIAKGMFWSTNNTYQLREIHGNARSKLISTITGIGYLIEVILPISLGSLIVLSGYELVFALGGAIYLISILYPWKYNKKPREAFQLKEIKRLTRRKGFGKWSLLSIFDELFANQRSLALTVLPFLFIGDEFGVGALGSFLGIVSGIVVYTLRNDSIKKKIRFGYVGATIIDIANLLLTFLWSLPMLVIRGVIAKVGFALYTPPSSTIKFDTRELLLGEFSMESAVEMELLAEMLRFFARMINLIAFVVIFFYLSVDQMLVLQLIWAITAVHEILTFFLFNRIQKDFRK